MKRILSVLTLMATAFWLSAPAFPATATSGPYTTTINVTPTLDMKIDLTSNGMPVSQMDFGSMVKSADGTCLVATKSVVARITITSSGAPFTLTQMGTQMMSSNAYFPMSACVLTPIYDPSDNNGKAMPSGASLGSLAGWAYIPNEVVYRSDAAGQSCTVQAIYSIGEQGGLASGSNVPLNQQAGTYTGQVTFTVTS